MRYYLHPKPGADPRTWPITPSRAGALAYPDQETAERVRAAAASIWAGMSPRVEATEAAYRAVDRTAHEIRKAMEAAAKDAAHAVVQPVKDAADEARAEREAAVRMVVGI